MYQSERAAALQEDNGVRDAGGGDERVIMWKYLFDIILKNEGKERSPRNTQQAAAAAV